MGRATAALATALWLPLAPANPQDAPPRLRVYLDQRTPPAAARQAMQAAESSGVPFEAYVVVRDLGSLDAALLAWEGIDPRRLRLADAEALDELERSADRLPCFLIERDGLRHRAHGLPRDIREMDTCTRSP